MDLVLNNFTTDDTFKSGYFYDLIKKASKIVGLKRDWNMEFSVNIVGERRIKFLNRKYGKKNKVTDVLSFPIADGLDLKKRSSDPALLGDIFVCLPFAKKQAKRENISINEKISRLVIHGFLHLLGYDHEKSEKDRVEMEKLEEKILS